MAYEKLNLKNGDVLTAEHLEHIEEGIGNALEPDDVELIQELKGGGGTATDGASYVFEHTLTISIKDADGNEAQKASITAVDPYRRALASGYKGSEFGFYNDVVAAVQGAWGKILIDGLDYDDTDNKLYLTSGGSRVPAMSVVLPENSGPAGESGVTTPVNGFFTLSVDSDGNLWAHSAENGTTPDFEYDSETGNLYFVTEE